MDLGLNEKVIVVSAQLVNRWEQNGGEMAWE